MFVNKCRPLNEWAKQDHIYIYVENGHDIYIYICKVYKEYKYIIAFLNTHISLYIHIFLFLYICIYIYMCICCTGAVAIFLLVPKS